jgi:TolB-like protein
VSVAVNSAATAGRVRLDSWKEIAAYLGRSERTVRRWEEREGLPVHRLQHEQRGSVYAYCAELDAWLESRKQAIEKLESPNSVALPAASQRDRQIWILAVAAGLLLVTVAILRPWNPPARGPVIASIAVLPFDNLSRNAEEEWFSEGMTETLITELAKVRGLKVISRTSVMQYKNVKKPLKQVGAELGVDAVVEGSVLRVGDRVRITAQLIRTSTDTHLWGSDFDREMKDVLTLHRDVAQAIAHQVGATAKAEPGARTPGEVNPQAMAAYLKGLYQFNRGALKQAVDLAQEGIRIDPQMAHAHELLGMTWIWAADRGVKSHAELVPPARIALRRALDLEPDRAVALSWMGSSYMTFEHDWVKAEANMRRAYELDPSTGTGYGFLLATQGRYAEAIRAADRALEHDPANPLYIADAGRIYHMARRYPEAVQFFRKASDLSPSDSYPRTFLAYSLWASRQPDVAAWLWFRDGKGPLGLEKDFWEDRRRQGWSAVWQAFLEKAPRDRNQRQLLLPLMALRWYSEALDALEALENQGSAVLVVLEDPVFDPLRQEPRFKALLQRVGYPASVWR